MSHEVALLDVNLLFAISEPAQVHHSIAMKWFSRLNQPWAICGITEAGFLRVATNPRVGARSIPQATAFITRLTSRPNCVFWSVSESWVQLARPLGPASMATSKLPTPTCLDLPLPIAELLSHWIEPCSHWPARNSEIMCSCSARFSLGTTTHQASLNRAQS